VHPDAWLTQDKKWARIDAAQFSKAQILAKAQADFTAAAWDKAAGHEHGKGLEGGPHLHIAKSAKKALVREGSFAAAAALDHVVTGCLFDPRPNPAGHFRHEQLCSMCGFAAPATCLHMFWKCPGLGDIKHPIMGQTAHLVTQAINGFDEYPCLYARGLVPRGFSKIPELPDYLDVKTWRTDNFSELLSSTHKGYSDGTGGNRNMAKSTLRVAFGAAVFQADLSDDQVINNEVAAMGGQVPGKQTVPRAELWAAIQVTAAANLATEIDIGIDASYVTNGVLNMDRLSGGNNGDLWSILARLVKGRVGNTLFHKIPSTRRTSAPAA
jgi:hypothetical protein